MDKYCQTVFVHKFENGYVHFGYLYPKHDTIQPTLYTQMMRTKLNYTLIETPGLPPFLSPLHRLELGDEHYRPSYTLSDTPVLLL